jgi:hypothetical protein
MGRKKVKTSCNICMDKKADIKCNICIYECCNSCINKWYENSRECPSCKNKRTYKFDGSELYDSGSSESESESESEESEESDYFEMESENSENSEDYQVYSIYTVSDSDYELDHDYNFESIPSPPPLEPIFAGLPWET